MSDIKSQRHLKGRLNEVCELRTLKLLVVLMFVSACNVAVLLFDA